VVSISFTMKVSVRRSSEGICMRYW
jgi:hypothetical protein